jgi:hypothetical protein
VSTSAAAEAELAPRLAELSELGCWEWQILAFADERLLLIGGGDMVYSHGAEASFQGVTFISCPTRMMHARFRLATEHEARASGASAALEPGAAVVAIESDTINDFDRAWFITARSVEVTRGRFLHTAVDGPRG